MKQVRGSFDFLLDCVSAPHDMDAYLKLLKLNGTLCLVGLPPDALSVQAFSLSTNRRSLASSSIGGLAETQDMLDFCAEHDIVADIEMVAVNGLEEAYERVVKSDVKYRFVIDLASLQSQSVRA